MKVIYVYSGKGGVGKSSVCVNLAYSIRKLGLSVGIFDADLSGPSIPSMVRSVEDVPQKMVGISIVPGIYGDIKVSSIGFNDQVIDSAFWTGKYLKGALYQLAISVKWDVDVLLVDLPPGTGELHREIFIYLPGKAVLVTTPQEVSYQDVIRSIDFINRLDIDIIGVIENMSFYECNECKTRVKVFTGDTKARLCEICNVDLLAELPIIPEMNVSFNNGFPYLLKLDSKEYNDLAKDILSRYDDVLLKGRAN